MRPDGEGGEGAEAGSHPVDNKVLQGFQITKEITLTWKSCKEKQNYPRWDFDFGIHVTGYYEVPPWVILFFLRRLPGSSEIGKGILLVLSMILARKQCLDEYNICFSEKKTSYN